jgi:hypothetical protein
MTTDKFNIASAFILQPLDHRVPLMFTQCLAIRDKSDVKQRLCSHFTVHHTRHRCFESCPMYDLNLMLMELWKLTVFLLLHEWLALYCET